MYITILNFMVVIGDRERCLQAGMDERITSEYRFYHTICTISNYFSRISTSWRSLKCDQQTCRRQRCSKAPPPLTTSSDYPHIFVGLPAENSCQAVRYPSRVFHLIFLGSVLDSYMYSRGQSNITFQVQRWTRELISLGDHWDNSI